jgi:hypothetical protein
MASQSITSLQDCFLSGNKCRGLSLSMRVCCLRNTTSQSSIRPNCTYSSSHQVTNTHPLLNYLNHLIYILQPPPLPRAIHQRQSPGQTRISSTPLLALTSRPLQLSLMKLIPRIEYLSANPELWNCAIAVSNPSSSCMRTKH